MTTGLVGRCCIGSKPEHCKTTTVRECLASYLERHHRRGRHNVTAGQRHNRAEGSVPGEQDGRTHPLGANLGAPIRTSTSPLGAGVESEARLAQQPALAGGASARDTQPPLQVTAYLCTSTVAQYASAAHLMAFWVRWYSTNGLSPGITTTTCTDVDQRPVDAAVVQHACICRTGVLLHV